MKVKVVNFHVVNSVVLRLVRIWNVSGTLTWATWVAHSSCLIGASFGRFRSVVAIHEQILVLQLFAMMTKIVFVRNRIGSTPVFEELLTLLNERSKAVAAIFDLLDRFLARVGEVLDLTGDRLLLVQV